MPVGEKSLVGCFLEVDLEYSDTLHKLHNDYPEKIGSRKTCCFL